MGLPQNRQFVRLFKNALRLAGVSIKLLKVLGINAPNTNGFLHSIDCIPNIADSFGIQSIDIKEKYHSLYCLFTLLTHFKTILMYVGKLTIDYAPNIADNFGI